MSGLSNNVSWNHGQGLMDESASMIQSKQIPHHVKADPQMEQVDDFVTSIHQPAHLLVGSCWFQGTMGEG